jgi:hypothetical protein
VNVVCCQGVVSAFGHPSGGVLPSLKCLSDIYKFSEKRDHDRNAVRSATERKYIHTYIHTYIYTQNGPIERKKGVNFMTFVKI